MTAETPEQTASELPANRMAEAEVALRLAFHVLALPGASRSVTVCLDDQHVASGGNIVFPIAAFLSSEGWQQASQSGKRIWQGTYKKGSAELQLIPDSRGGDVIANIGSMKLRAECKKGPLERTKGNPENKLVHEAIGQLMTIEAVDEQDVLVVAVPMGEPCRSKLAWQERPLMRDAGIHLVLVGRDGTVEGLPNFGDLDGLDDELRWADVRPELDEFQSLLSSNVAKLQIERSEDVLDWEVKKGVYLLFGENEQLLYVGFTLDGFGKRIKVHETRFDCRRIDLIIPPDEYDFLVPALEVFLRRRLLPLLDEGGEHV